MMRKRVFITLVLIFIVFLYSILVFTMIKTKCESILQVIYLILGALLALLGSFVTQRWIEKRTITINTRKAATYMYLDMTRILIYLRKVIVTLYGEEIKKVSFNISNDYIAKTADLIGVLSKEEILLVHNFYTRLLYIEESITDYSYSKLTDVATEFFNNLGILLMDNMKEKIIEIIQKNDFSNESLNKNYYEVLVKLNGIIDKS